MSPTSTRPRILITTQHAAVGGRWDDYSADYARAIAAAGGDAIPIHFDHYIATEVPKHDGLVIIGGVDVDPARYGEPRHRAVQRSVPARDEMEIDLARRALDERRPLLAICRGAQVMNVACGGSLLQHIEERMPHRGPAGTDESGWHGVAVTTGSLLARIAGEGPLLVNSRHHQAVTPDRLAPALVESGRTEEGGLIVLEAFEAPDHPFALGVQWHPERPEMSADPAHQAASNRLFEAFVAVSRTVKPPIR